MLIAIGTDCIGSYKSNYDHDHDSTYINLEIVDPLVNVREETVDIILMNQ
jgi:hypothetical protein